MFIEINCYLVRINYIWKKSIKNFYKFLNIDLKFEHYLIKIFNCVSYVVNVRRVELTGFRSEDKWMLFDRKYYYFLLDV